MATEIRLCACGCQQPVREARNTWIKGHNRYVPRLHIPKFCACGCGEQLANPHRTWVKGHHMRSKETAPQTRRRVGRQLCSCGCGELANYHRTFLRGHANRSKAASPEGKQAMRETFFEATGLWAPTMAEAAVMTGLWHRSIRFLFQIPVEGICKPDFLFPDARIILQIDDSWHQKSSAQQKDSREDAALMASGWHVLRWSNEQVDQKLHSLLDTLQACYESRLKLSRCRSARAETEQEV